MAPGVKIQRAEGKILRNYTDDLSTHDRMIVCVAIIRNKKKEKIKFWMLQNSSKTSWKAIRLCEQLATIEYIDEWMKKFKIEIDISTSKEFEIIEGIEMLSQACPRAPLVSRLRNMCERSAERKLFIKWKSF